MKKHFSLWLALLCVFSMNVSRSQNKSFIIAPYLFSKNGASYSQLPAPAPPNSQYPFQGYDGRPADLVQNVQLDATGNILFFIVDEQLFDKDGNYIETLTEQASNKVDGYCELAVNHLATKDGNCHRYLLISTRTDYNNAFTPSQKIYYGYLEIEYSTSTGTLTSETGFYTDASFTTQIVNSVPCMFPLVEVNQDTDNEVNGSAVLFALSKKNQSNEQILFIRSKSGIYKYDITSNGYITNPVLVDYTQLFPGSSNFQTYFQNRGEMECVVLPNGNYRVALPVFHNGNQNDQLLPYFGVMISEFDPNGNLLSSPAQIVKYEYPYQTNVVDRPYVYGLEFSENGNYLYVTHNNQVAGSNNPFDVITILPGTHVKTALNLNSMIDFKKSQIEQDLNGSIVLVNSTGFAQFLNANNGFINNSQWDPYFVNHTPGFTYQQSSYPRNTPNLQDQHKTYLLQDEIDGANYSSPYTVQPCCIDFANFEIESLTVPSNQTWNNSSNGGTPVDLNGNDEVEIRTELRIPQGVVLTINDITVKFADGARLVIEEGNPLTGVYELGTWYTGVRTHGIQFLS